MKTNVALSEARAFIEAHFDEPVTLAQLAELSALSVPRFVTVFPQQFGSLPYRYLCGLRIERAQRSLLTGLPGSMVAAEVGFFDQSHLARHFKQFLRHDTDCVFQACARQGCCARSKRAR